MDLLLILVVIALPALAHLYIMFNYNRYKGVSVNSNNTGAEIARKILDINGLTNVRVVEVSGYLSDNYNSNNKTVSLSSDIYHGRSISATSIAAHECGHAIQDKEGYSFFRLRHAMFPIVRVATSISYWIIFLGFLFEFFGLLYFGIALTSMGLLFEIVTLPVEFNASRRAIENLEKHNLIIYQEKRGCKKVLKAAAYTYVAGTLSSAIQILRLILIANSRRD